MLTPTLAIVHIPMKQATLGNSGKVFLKPGVVRPVASRGAESPGHDFPLATKYGNEPPLPVQKPSLDSPAVLLEEMKLLTAIHLSYKSQPFLNNLWGRTVKVEYISPWMADP